MPNLFTGSRTVLSILKKEVYDDLDGERVEKYRSLLDRRTILILIFRKKLCPCDELDGVTSEWRSLKTSF